MSGFWANFVSEQPHYTTNTDGLYEKCKIISLKQKTVVDQGGIKAHLISLFFFSPLLDQ